MIIIDDDDDDDAKEKRSAPSATTPTNARFSLENTPRDNTSETRKKEREKERKKRTVALPDAPERVADRRRRSSGVDFFWRFRRVVVVL